MAEQLSPITTEYITLDAFLKWAGAADTGGHAKILISSGEVRVNGEVELRRGRKLRPGDCIELPENEPWRITQGQA
jgi:ribosome-associated protein